MKIQTLVLRAVLITMCSFPAFSDQIVAPLAFTNTEGSSSSSGVLLGNSRTLQYVYSAAELGFSSGTTLTGLSYRLNSGQSTNIALTWANYDIQLSQSLFGPGALSNVFASNVGMNAVTVRSGALSFVAGAFPAGGSPNAFGPEIVFATPYLYQGGDLLVTIRHTGNTQGVGYFADSTPNANGQHEGQGAAGYTASSFTAGQSVTNTAIIMDFYAVPEPGTAWLIIGAAGMFALVRARRGFKF